MATIPPRGSKRLGRQVELDEDGKNRYVDFVLVLPGLCAKRNTLRIARPLTLTIKYYVQSSGNALLYPNVDQVARPGASHEWAPQGW